MRKESKYQAKYHSKEERISVNQQREKKWREEHKEEIKVKRIAEKCIPRLQARIAMYMAILNKYNEEHPQRPIKVLSAKNFGIDSFDGIDSSDDDCPC
jgi:hypothetical protein